MTYEDILPEIIIGFSGTFSGWLFARRKNRLEQESKEIENIEKAVAVWREIAEDLKKVIDEKQNLENSLRQEIAELRERIRELENNQHKR